MSAAARELKKQQAENYIRLHPDSQDIQVVGGPVFRGIFDSMVAADEGDGGFRPIKYARYTVTFYIGDRGLFTAGETRVKVGGKTYEVNFVQCDGDGVDHLGALWLV